MARYRRSYAPRRTSYRGRYRSAPRYTGRRRTTRRSASRSRRAAPRTVRIVIEQPGASLARPDMAVGIGAKTPAAPKRAKF